MVHFNCQRASYRKAANIEAKFEVVVVPLALDIPDLAGVLPLQAIEKLLHAVLRRLLTKLVRN